VVKKKNKKIILSLGSLATAGASVAGVISCGDTTNTNNTNKDNTKPEIKIANNGVKSIFGSPIEVLEKNKFSISFNKNTGVKTSFLNEGLIKSLFTFTDDSNVIPSVDITGFDKLDPENGGELIITATDAFGNTQQATLSITFFVPLVKIEENATRTSSNEIRKFATENDLINAIKGLSKHAPDNVYVGNIVKVGNDDEFEITQEKFDELKIKNSYKGTFTSDDQRNKFLAINETIDDNSFKSENGLTMISLPRVKTVGAWAFGDVTSIIQVHLPNVETIKTNGFRSANVTSYNLPNLMHIGDNIFGIPSEAKVTELYLPKLIDYDDNGGHSDWSPLSGVVNAASTHVTLPIRFNTDDIKNDLFGEGNWDQITFVWITSSGISITINDINRTIFSDNIVFTDGTNESINAVIIGPQNQDLAQITQDMLKDAFIIKDKNNKVLLGSSVRVVGVANLDSVNGGTITITASDEDSNTLTVNIEIVKAAKLFDTENDLINAVKGFADDPRNNVHVNDWVKLGANRVTKITQGKIDELKMKNSYKGSFSSDGKRNEFLSITTRVNNNQFTGQGSLTFISLPRVTLIGQSAFAGSYKILGADLPNLQEIWKWGFSSAPLTFLNAPKLERPYQGAFQATPNSGSTKIIFSSSLNVDGTKNLIFDSHGWGNINFIWV